MSKLRWLLICLLWLHCGVLVTAQPPATPVLDRFESAIVEFERHDRQSPALSGGTLFVGSSTFTLWGHELEQQFAEFQPLNRGFGGATIAEINHYFPRLVLPYRPRRIVFYAGTNDVADGHSATRIRDDFQAFVKLSRQALPQVKIAFISMSVPPSRERWAATYREGNRLIQEWMGSDPSLYYIDVSTLLLDPQGHPQRGFFREDALHMRASGYALWVPRIRETLKRMTGDIR